MRLKSSGAWLAVAVVLLGASPARADKPAEIAAKLADAKAALTAARGQLTQEQWALLSGKLASAEQALAEYQAVAAAGRTAAAAEGASAAARGEALAAEGEVVAARGATAVLGRVVFVFLALATIESDEGSPHHGERERRALEEQLQEVGRAAERVKVEIEEAGRSADSKPARTDEKEEDEDGDAHHIATNKNETSTARGGPWTPRFRALFAKAGMELSDPANQTRVKGHRGPHPEAYHQEVYRQLSLATSRCGPVAQCRESLTKMLIRLGILCATPGTELNRLITTPALP